jgi:FAD/FMN-containing dehydrogenase
LLLGGGLSFLSAQGGLAADNIIGWETTMANGSVVNVDAASHPDLAKAMRGSGSQFGIVTKFTVQTYPIADVWGGFCVYPANQSEALYAALHNFVANGAQDPKAAVIFTDLILVGGASTKLIYYFYDAPAPPKSGPFADFFKIINPTCLPRTQKYSELVSFLQQTDLITKTDYGQVQANGAPVALLQARASFRVSVPYLHL